MPYPSSSNSSSLYGQTSGESSSSRIGARQPHVEDADDDADNAPERTDDLASHISFKRRAKNTSVSGFALPRFLSGFAQPPHPNGEASSNRSAIDLPLLDTDDDNPPGQTKDGSVYDWYAEGPGRRVGYDDLTAIDWIFEYAKERQRLRALYSTATGLAGYVRQVADAAQIWVVLIVTGIAVGAIAACIDVVSDWLGDLKAGVCRDVDQGGRFYLNRAFCCWGAEDLAQCSDWQPWSDVFGVRASKGGWILEYMVFLILSVGSESHQVVIADLQVLFAACASVLVKNYAMYAKHSGIPEIKTVLSGFVIRRFMGSWTLLIKSLGLCLAVASGLWLGKEGPLVHVACCCANLILKAFDTLNSNEARKREVLSAAAAAGISVAFGSPIGGVLFSLEQLSYYFPDKTMWQSFVCAMIGAVTLQAFNPFRTGKLVLYQVTYHSGWHGFEIIPFALLGILGGVYGGLFIRLNMKVAQWRRDRTYLKGPVLEVVLVALLTAIINYPIKFTRAQTSQLVYTLFAECIDITDDQLDLCQSGRANTGVITLLLIAAVLGFFLSAITFGLHIPAGIILPSMAIGALYGRAVGLILEVWQQAHPAWLIFRNCEADIPCITPGTYAIIGAASALGGATRMTVSIVVIMFELTGALTYVLPIMIAVLLSKWVGDAISPRGIYESWIQFNGYPLLDNRDDNAAQVPDVPAADIMTRIEDLCVITATGHTVATLTDLLAKHPYRGFPVIDDPRDALLLGYISRTELDFALRAAARGRAGAAGTEVVFAHQALGEMGQVVDFRAWMDQTPITLGARASLGLTVNMFQKLGLRYVLFVERGGLRGLLTKKDVWVALNEEGLGGGRDEGVGVERGEDVGGEYE
ncbi:hypothetical protein EJ06DRAFT_509390 [Trichodelitschia bisporula]|uniref:Chloride channel protein n=1 Tax=Trichodelitschia bisporula TaxID=703511 RepID=A0A6G1HXD0_9PEZI|nr:hypothetical protein EJ06DRAFT_509390 [Trichodelitschia bisporula]